MRIWKRETGMRVGSYFWHARSRFLGLLLFRVVGVKTGWATIWSGCMSKSAFVCVHARSCTWAADVPWGFLSFFGFCMCLSNMPHLFGDTWYLEKGREVSLTQVEHRWNVPSQTCTFGLAFSYICTLCIAFRGSSSGQQKLNVTFTVTLMGLFLVCSLLYLSAPIRADCAQDTITLLWKMSVSNPLCFRSLHVTSSLFHSFCSLVWVLWVFL